jgi:hypothetical protein
VSAPRTDERGQVGCRFDLLDAVGGVADGRIGPHDPADGIHGEVLVADVNACRAGSKGDVATVVDNDAASVGRGLPEDLDRELGERTARIRASARRG